MYLAMDGENKIIHDLDLTWAILGTIAGAYPLVRLTEHRHTQSARDLFALLLTMVAYPWAMAVMHLTPFGKGLVYAICVYTIFLFSLCGLRLLGLSEQKLAAIRPISLVFSTVLAFLAISNPWFGLFALFDESVPGQPNPLLDYQTLYIGAQLTLLYAGVVVVCTSCIAGARLLRSRFVLSSSLLGVLLQALALFAYANSALCGFFRQLQINPYFFTTTTALFYFSYLSQLGKISATLPPAHTQIISQMPDAIVIVDSNGVVVECNPAFQALVDKPTTSIFDHALSSLLPDTSFLENSETNRHMLNLSTAHGPQHLDLHITTLTSAESNAGGKMILKRDATSQTFAYQKLQENEW
jgi:PAS domain-containing protein